MNNWSFSGHCQNQPVPAVIRVSANLLLWFAILAFPPQNVHALGLGVGGSFGAGSIKDKSDSIFGDSTVTTKYTQKRYAIGGAFDSNLGQERLFNYRLGVAYQAMKADASDGKFDFKGVVVENHFGFALHRSDTLRLWAGPLVKVELLTGDETKAGYTSRESVFGLGFGPVVGLNQRLSNTLFLSGTIGYIFQSDAKIFGDRRENYGFLTLSLFFGRGRDRNL